jgi:hypothetical protein
MKDYAGKVAAAFDILNLPGQDSIVTHPFVKGTDFHQSEIGYFAIDIVKNGSFAQLRPPALSFQIHTAVLI